MIDSLKSTHAIIFLLFILLLNEARLAEKTQKRFITLQSTTSTESSGFYEYILPLFLKRLGLELELYLREQVKL